MRFTMQVFQQYEAENKQVQKFMLRNCMILFEFAILRSEEFFSEKLLNSIEPYLPFHREYARNIGKEFQFTDKMPLQAQERLFASIELMCKQVLDK